MKPTIFLLFIVFGLVKQGKCSECDTINVYWVYYNDSVWAKLNQNMEGSGYLLHIKKTNIKIKDSISVRSGTDMGRSEFQTVTIKDDSNNTIKSFTTELTGKNSYWIPFTFSLYEFIKNQ